MPRKKPIEPHTSTTFRCPESLHKSFAAACLCNAIPATYVLHQLMREYVKANHEHAEAVSHD